MNLELWMQRRSQLEAMQSTYKLHYDSRHRLMLLQDEAEQAIEEILRA